MTRRKPGNPIVVAIILFALLLIALIMYLASAAIDRQSSRQAATPWVPPGWVSPTSPPPSTE